MSSHDIIASTPGGRTDRDVIDRWRYAVSAAIWPVAPDGWPRRVVADNAERVTAAAEEITHRLPSLDDGMLIDLYTVAALLAADRALYSVADLPADPALCSVADLDPDLRSVADLHVDGQEGPGWPVGPDRYEWGQAGPAAVLVAISGEMARRDATHPTTRPRAQVARAIALASAVTTARATVDTLPIGAEPTELDDYRDPWGKSSNAP